MRNNVKLFLWLAMYEIPSSTPFGSPQLESKPLSQTWQMGPWQLADYLAVDMVFVSSWFKQYFVCYLNLKIAHFEELNIKDIVIFGHLTKNYHALQIISKGEVFHGLLFML